MTETTAAETAPPAPAPAAIRANPHLNAALAKLQASLPSITKGDKAKVPTKSGGSYEYSYANLADISAVVLPRMGEVGLAFLARPTMRDGRMVLAYSLLHESGEREDGIYPLASGTPQTLGGEITYARRYCLCAVTGVAPADDDDDGRAAEQHARQSASEAFESATPARPQNGRPAGQATRPAQPASSPASSDEPDEDAQPYADEAHEARTLPALKEVHVRAREAHKLAALIRNPATQGTGGLGAYLNYRKGVLEKADKALADLYAAAKEAGLDTAETEHRLMAASGKGIEDASAEDMEKAAGLIREGVAA